MNAFVGVLTSLVVVLCAATSTSTRSAEDEVAHELAIELAKEKARAAGEVVDETPPPKAEVRTEVRGDGGVQPTATATTGSKFIKGNLIYVGTRELVSRFDHVGVRLGPKIIGRNFFLGVTPTMAYYADRWAFAFHVPLNLLFLEGGSLDFGGAKIRRQDWDELSDYARLIRFITFGRKEAQVYFTVSNLRPTTLGHGQLIHFYQPNIDVDRSMTGLVLDGYNRWAGFQLQLNDVTFRNNVMGALVFVKPLAFVDSPIVQSLSLGMEYAADFRAPRCVFVSEDDRRCVPGAGNLAGFDPITGESRDDTFVRTDPDLGRPVVDDNNLVHAFGFSGELKFVKSESVDLKAYTTWHKFFKHGDGISAGLLGRYTFGDKWLNAFRTRTEFRTFAHNYVPAYWDTLYEISKYQFIQNKSTFQVSPTKFQAIFGDPDNGFVLTDTDRRFGFNAELSWALFAGNRSAKKIAFGVGLSDSTGDNDTNFYLHLELPVLKFVQLFGTFIRANAADPSKLFETSFDNAIVISGLRIQVLPFAFINASYAAAFQNIRRPGAEFHLGNENVVDEQGNTARFFTSDAIYETSHAVSLELEIGLEFRDSDDDEKKPRKRDEDES